MAREPLQRLHIPPLQIRPPAGFDNAPMFSPALPTALQQSFHPQYPLNSSLQTPMQSFFPMHPPAAPGRPHHQSHHSVAQLAAVGILPPHSGHGPITPLAGHFPRPSFLGGGPPFPHRSRRQPSIGGPPKAVLGGPGRKHSPLPPTAAPPAPAAKTKKLVVNLPKETNANEDGTKTRASWARNALDVPAVDTEVRFNGPQESTREIYPADMWAHHLPETLDVFLPGKTAWELMKQELIEQKLQKLGVERGSLPPVPQIHAPHARAASISSPADPALLYFKLNKLQQSQASQSLSTSPQPPFSISPSSISPGPLYATNRHGHSLSLAQPWLAAQSQIPQTIGSPSFLDSNAFSRPESMGFSSSPKPTYAADPSQGIRIAMPHAHAPLEIPSVPSIRSDSRPDFIRGFGLDIPEEEEPEEETDENVPPLSESQVVDQNAEPDFSNKFVGMPQGEDTEVILSRIHSRHVSRLSAALSQRNVENSTIESPPEPQVVASELDDAVEEWTCSEDQYDDTSDNESIGEWSNPSDEERARQQRVERRLRRRTASLSENAPRRLPNFPQPPHNNQVSLSLRQDDDIISNPSEEERMISHGAPQYLHMQQDDYRYPHSALSSGKTPRPLPALPSLPHSRVPSHHFPPHDPSTAHSRTASSQNEPHQSRHSETLNPHAKPFVFGRRDSWLQETVNPSTTPPVASSAGHSRLPSLGATTLSAAAPEFKPSFVTGFTFRPPAGVPQMPVLSPALLQPVDEASVENTPHRAQQGREKRQRRGSGDSYVEEDSILSFKFPLKPESPAPIHHSNPSGQSAKYNLNPDAPPFTFSLPKAIAVVTSSPKVDPTEVHATTSEDPAADEDVPENLAKPPKRKPLADLIISPTKGRSASMHMDFRHPVSQNTVPAGLFKALVNGEERTRRTVRSRLSSREIFENFRRPSLDDIDVPTISKKVSRQRLVTDPGMTSSPIEDVFGSSTLHTRRRSSLPNALHSPSNSLSTNMSMDGAMDLTGRFELQHYESKIEDMLDKKMKEIRQDMSKSMPAQSFNPNMEAAIADVLSLFRTELQQSASRAMDDDNMDARGELDLELLKGIVQQGNSEAQTQIQRQLESFLDRVTSTTSYHHDDFAHRIEQIHSRVMEAVSNSLSKVSEQLNSFERNGGGSQELVVDSLMSALHPVLADLQQDPVDYDFLTARLAQAVKPHISQLIDLSSDKQETAGLIVDRILPLLPTAKPSEPPFDADALTLQLVSEVRRAIAPIDAFEIKEQVADLVVERLDSRLAVRDKALTPENMTTKVVEGVQSVLAPVTDLSSTLNTVAEGQATILSQHSKMQAAQTETHDFLQQLPSQLDAISQAISSIRTSDTSSSEKAPALSNLNVIKLTIEQFISEQKQSFNGIAHLVADQKAILEHVESLPSFTSTTSEILQHIQTEMALTVRTAQREADEIRKSNADYQVQLVKARSAHGQIRVEKDRLQEKLSGMELEQERLRARIKELETSSESKALELLALEAKASKQEDGLSQALSRLQASDVEKQASRTTIAELEAAKRELHTENQSLKSKVESLELHAVFATRDKENAAQAMSTLQRQYDNLASQQNNWDDLRATSSRIEKLTALLGEADSQELRELRSIRDNSRMLEGEHAALKRRCSELENTVSISEKATATARQNLTQAQQRAQQRAIEWENKVRDYEAKIEIMNTRLEQMEQTHAQLDADHSTVRLQLEEKEAEERSTKEREAKMKEQINALEAKTKRLQNELLQSVSHRAPASKYNGNGINGRPSSRASTVIVDYPGTGPSTVNGSRAASSSGSATPPNSASVWDSIHAPSTTTASNYYAPRASHTPASRYPHLGPVTPKANRTYHRTYIRNAPSPTPSTVSQAPTLGEDGWYS